MLGTLRVLAPFPVKKHVPWLHLHVAESLGEQLYVQVTQLPTLCCGKGKARPWHTQQHG